MGCKLLGLTLSQSWNNRAEIEELQKNVNQERDNYQMLAQSDSGGVSAVPFFNINDQFHLRHEDASYVLSIEVETAIDNVLLQVSFP